MIIQLKNLFQKNKKKKMLNLQLKNLLTQINVKKIKIIQQLEMFQS